MDAHPFCYERQQTTDNDRYARSDKGEAADGVALKKVLLELAVFLTFLKKDCSTQKVVISLGVCTFQLF